MHIPFDGDEPARLFGGDVHLRGGPAELTQNVLRAERGDYGKARRLRDLTGDLHTGKDILGGRLLVQDDLDAELPAGPLGFSQESP